MHQQMQDQMNEQATTSGNFSNDSHNQKAKPDASKGDYIEFEEIK
jgi:hypothetical protein